MTGIQRVFLGRDEDHSQKGSVYVLSCIRLCRAVYCSPPGCFVCGIFQARIPGPVVISYSRGIFLTWDRTRISCLLPWHEGSLPLAPSAQIVYQGLKHKVTGHLREQKQVLGIWKINGRSEHPCFQAWDSQERDPLGLGCSGVLKAKTLRARS